MIAEKKRQRHWKGLTKRVELKAGPVWVNRVHHQATAAGISFSDYIRRAVEDQLARDEMYQSSKR